MANQDQLMKDSTKKIRSRYFVYLCLASIHVIQAFGQGGKTGLAFLKLGVGARSIGMGEAHAAVASDASATYYNPAGLVEGTSIDVMLMHKEWFQGVRTQYLGVNLPFKNVAFGLGVNTTNIDGIELRTRPGPPEGTFSTHDFSLGLSASGRLSESLDIGITVKFLYEKIFVDEASGAAADVGFLYKGPIEGLRLALVGSNFGSMGSLRQQKIRLPSLLRLGSSFVHELKSAQSTLTVAADVIRTFREERTHLHMGAEMRHREVVSVRIGYLSGYEARGLTLGAGVQRDFFKLDYGFSPQSLDLRNGHTFSLGVEF